MRNVLKLSENDLKNGSKSSWHDEYKDSAWIFVGGLPYDLSEGDIICVFSQYGEIVNINLVRDKLTGKQKGFCFICFEDQRSTILSVDNLNGIKVRHAFHILNAFESMINKQQYHLVHFHHQILGKTLRVDHVKDYKPPKDDDKMDEETKRLQMEGCAPKPQLPADQIKKEFIEPKSEVVGGVRLPMRLPIGKIEIKRESDIKEEITHKVSDLLFISRILGCILTSIHIFRQNLRKKKNQKRERRRKRARRSGERQRRAQMTVLVPAASPRERARKKRDEETDTRQLYTAKNVTNYTFWLILHILYAKYSTIKLKN